MNFFILSFCVSVSFSPLLLLSSASTQFPVLGDLCTFGPPEWAQFQSATLNPSQAKRAAASSLLFCSSWDQVPSILLCPSRPIKGSSLILCPSYARPPIRTARLHVRAHRGIILAHSNIFHGAVGTPRITPPAAHSHRGHRLHHEGHLHLHLDQRFFILFK